MPMGEYGLTLVTPPAEEPLTLAQARDWCRVEPEHAGQDSLLSRLIRQARERCERVADVALVTQTWRVSADGFPVGDGFKLPRPPLQAVTEVSYIDAEGVTRTLDASGYAADATRQPGWLLPAYGLSWPATRCQANAVLVTFRAGYGAAADVPGEVVGRLLADVAYCFARREEQDQAYLESLYHGLWSGIY